MDKIITAKGEVFIKSGDDTIWFTKFPDKSAMIGVNFNSHASVSGRWDIPLTEKELIDLIEKLKKL